MGRGSHGTFQKPQMLGPVRRLETLPTGLHTEGLFRRSASVQTVREIQRLYNQGEWLPKTLPVSLLPGQPHRGL